MAKKPSDFPIFTELSEQEIKARIEKLANCIGDIPAMLGLPDLQVDAKCITQIIDKVEKRRVYFHIFHNGMEMGELNEFSLYCFWIIKLSPFKHQSAQNNELNAKIAVKLLLNAVRKVADKDIAKQFKEIVNNNKVQVVTEAFADYTGGVSGGMINEKIIHEYKGR